MKVLKLFLIFCISLCIYTTAFAQSNIKRFDLGDSIRFLYTDTCLHNHYILAATSILKSDNKKSKKMMNMILFNIETGKEQWRKPFNIRESEIHLTPEGIIFSVLNKTFLLNYEDGKVLWKKSGYLYGLELRNSGFLYFPMTLNEKLEYCDLKTGARRWAVSMGAEIWDQYYYINDSTMCIVYRDHFLQGLQRLNLRNGELKNYDTMGIRKTRSRSNLIYNDSCFYMLDKQKLFCLDDNLNEIWHYELPRKYVSQAFIYPDSAHIYMVNFGADTSDYKLKTEGYPFV